MTAETTTMRSLALTTSLTLLATPALAGERPWVGDPINGSKIYKTECASCHGDDGDGGRSAVSLRDSGRLNAMLGEQLVAIVKSGKGTKRPDEHSFEKKLAFLDLWDVIAHTRTLHQELSEFFPNASRYLVGTYTIDEFGLERIKKATGKGLKDKAAPVFTFFDFDGEAGNLRYIPNDPILLDQLKKKFKSGYLVFLPFETKGFKGELGVGMDKDGVITKLLVPNTSKDAELLNKDLSRFEGEGRKGQKDPFKAAGGKDKALAEAVFAAYLRAMETVTMYDRDERERTWADDE